MNARGHWFVVVLLGLCSIGADDCTPASTPSTPPIDPNNYCYTDPPVGCAAYCSGPDDVTFTPACKHISAGQREIDFENFVITGVNALLAQGKHTCPQADPSNLITPCMTNFPPVQWPNQSACTPPPAGCPLP